MWEGHQFLVENDHSRKFNHTMHEKEHSRKRVRTAKDHPHSHTHTKTKTKERENGMEVIRGNVMEFTDKITLNQKKVKKNPVGFWKLSNTASGQLLGFAGQQGTTDILSIGSISQCVSSNGITANNFQSELAYFDGNPYQGTPVGGGNNGVLRPKDDECVLRASQLKFLFSSGSIGASHIDIYVYVCKQPTSLKPSELWNQSYIDTNLGQPGAVKPVGSTTVGVAGYPTRDFIFQTPHDAKTLKRFWKQQEHRAFRMEQSSTVEWNLNILHNKILRKDKITGYQLSAPNTFAGTNVYMPGSIVIMGVCKGIQVVKDTVVGSVSSYTTASASVDYVCRTDVMLHGVPDAADRLDYRRVNQTIDTLAPNANQQSFFDQVNTAAEVIMANIAQN